MMEGISSEAASLAGHLRLSNLCWIYDSNRVTIEGHTDIAFTEDVAARFLAYGWDILRVTDANDIDTARAGLPRFPAHQRSADADRRAQPYRLRRAAQAGHARGTWRAAWRRGSAADQAVLRLRSRRSSSWCPNGVREHFAANMGARGAKLRGEWQAMFARYRAEHPDLADQIDCISKRELPDGWEAALPVFPPRCQRNGHARCIRQGAERRSPQRIPWLIGGAADLSPSTKTRYDFRRRPATFSPASVHTAATCIIGVREHAMCAMVNGMTLTGLRAFGSGFLIFTDYARGAIRLASLMDLPVLHIWTHDSISVGEDGPTHQPIEQMLSLRAIPGMVVIRPADANEMSRGLSLCHAAATSPGRADLFAPGIADRRSHEVRAGCGAGEGCLRADRCAEWQAGRDPHRHRQRSIAVPRGARQTGRRGRRCACRQHAVMGTVRGAGCSVSRQRLAAIGDGARDSRGRGQVGLASLRRDRGVVLGMHTFGMSAPIKVVAEHFGFTVDAVVAAARQTMSASAQ